MTWKWDILEVASMVVTWWIAVFCVVRDYLNFGYLILTIAYQDPIAILLYTRLNHF